MELLKEIRKPIEADLKRLGEMLSDSLTSDNELLNVALRHITQRAGKQMRPILMFLAARGVDDVPTVLDDRVVHAALSMELLHSASLVHDDIVDESDRRRGQPSVNSLLGNKAAVLVGDFLLSKAIHHAVLSGNPRVVEIIASVGSHLSDGELLQLNNVQSEVIEESVYYDVIRKKTASLFSACAEIGALLVSDDPGYVFTMRRFGMLLGICFQLRDDIFDFDSTLDTGKPAGNDLREGKLTLPVIYTCSKNAEAAVLAMKVRAAEATPEDIDTLLRLTKQEGGVVYAEGAMKEMSQLACGLLDDVKEKQIAIALQNYLNFVSKRTH